jgi:hypothetical protein
MQVKAWTRFSPRYEAGALDEPTWAVIRSSLGGRPSPARDKRITDSIRRFEPTAPADEIDLRKRYAHFFHDSTDTAPTSSSQMSISGSNLSAGRFFYIHRCIVSVEFFVPYPSKEPMTRLNIYMEQMELK